MPAALHDLVVDAVPDRHPAGDVGGQAALAGDPDRALDRDPAHQPGVRVVPAAAARLPDPLVGLVPVVDQPLEVAGELHPAVVVDGQPVLVAEVDGVHQLAVDVELQLGRRPVADPHRRRAHVALQVRELLLGQVLAPVDAVHDLQRARLAVGRVAEAPLQPLHERAGLLGEPEPEQRVEREGGVAHPRVAVVPVACAAELLRQAGGGGGHDRAGGRVGEQLERERRAMHHLAPAPAVARAAQPAAARTPRWRRTRRRCRHRSTAPAPRRARRGRARRWPSPRPGGRCARGRRRRRRSRAGSPSRG